MFKKFFLALLITSLAACKVSPINERSRIELPLNFSHTTNNEHNNNLRQLHQWWQLWGDQQLNFLIETALQQNLDISLAEEKIEEARYLSQQASSDLWPTIGLAGQFTKLENANVEFNQSNSPIPIEPTAQLPTLSRAAGLVINWEPDLFGRKHSTQQAAQYAWLAKHDQRNGVRVLVAGEIANNYVQAASVLQQLALIKSTLASLNELERYVIGRFNAGQTPASNINKSKVQRAELQSKQVALEGQLNLFKQSIAVLVGQVPQRFQFKINTSVLKNIPALPSGITPSDILLRRPDLRARTNAIHALAQQSQVVRSDLMPRFFINFTLLNGRVEIADLPSAKISTPIFSLGATLPIFTAKRIMNNIKQADSRLKQAIIEYDKNLLQALQEIDSAYHMAKKLQQATKLQLKAVDLATKHIEKNQRLYANDYVTYQEVLEAQLEAIDKQKNLIKTRLNQAYSNIKLYQALGGGWQFEEGKP